jgi:hypothetical protein
VKGIKGERRGGFYWVDGVPYVSVTNVLKSIAKPQLRYWSGQQVYRAFAKDPTLSEKEALRAPYQESAKAKDRGRTVHSIIESFKTIKEPIKDIPKQFRGYANAFYSWVEDSEIEIKEREKVVISKKYGFGGTLDILADRKEKTLLTEAKTGKAIYPEAWLQLSAYKQAVEEEGQKVDEIAVLLLKENGKYIFEKGEPDLQAFLACKDLWIWQNKELYAQMMKGVKSSDSNK